VSAADADPILVASKPALRSMQAYLLSGEREQPVVALTWSVETDEPVLAPEEVRVIVGPGPRIYLIQQEYLLRRLQGLLGPLALSRGSARVWWPGLSVSSDAGEHPLVLELDGEPHRRLLGEFAREFDLSRPLVRREIKLIEATRRLAEHELAQAGEQNREMKIERHEALARAEAAEASLKGRAQQLGEMDCEETLHSLISREWREKLTAADRRAYPLGGYVLTPEFVAMVQRQAGLPLEKLAWVCAMVACGYAPALTGIAPHALVIGPGGPQIERADGAKGWRCSLKRNASGGSRLHYWVCSDGIIEFAGVGNHDELRAV
jgi:hypothetical protein